MEVKLNIFLEVSNNYKDQMFNMALINGFNRIAVKKILHFNHFTRTLLSALTKANSFLKIFIRKTKIKR